MMSEDIKSQVLSEFGNYLHKIIEFIDILDISEIKFHVGELERILKKGKRREIYLRKFRARGERMRRNKI